MPTVRQGDVPPDVWEKLRTAAGMSPIPNKKRKRPDVRTGAASCWSITLTLACGVISEANRRDHWTVQRRRAEIQKEALGRVLESAGLVEHTVPLPVVVSWVRVGRQNLDDDNLARSFKALRDALAKWLDVDDGDPRVKWQYEQIPGEPGVVVKIGNRTQGGE